MGPPGWSGLAWRTWRDWAVFFHTKSWAASAANEPIWVAFRVPLRLPVAVPLLPSLSLSDYGSAKQLGNRQFVSAICKWRRRRRRRGDWGCTRTGAARAPTAPASLSISKVRAARPPLNRTRAIVYWMNWGHSVGLIRCAPELCFFLQVWITSTRQWTFSRVSSLIQVRWCYYLWYLPYNTIAWLRSIRYMILPLRLEMSFLLPFTYECGSAVLTLIKLFWTIL